MALGQPRVGVKLPMTGIIGNQVNHATYIRYPNGCSSQQNMDIRLNQNNTRDWNIVFSKRTEMVKVSGSITRYQTTVYAQVSQVPHNPSMTREKQRNQPSLNILNLISIQFNPKSTLRHF